MCFLLSVGTAFADLKEDTLRSEVQVAPTDSLRCAALYRLGYYQFFQERNLAGSSINLFAALQLADRYGFAELTANCNDALSWIEERKENYYKSVQYAEKAFSYYSKSDDDLYRFKADYNLGCLLLGVKEKEHSELHLRKALKLARDLNKKSWILNSLQAMGGMYRDQGKFHQAKTVTWEAAEIMKAKSGTYGNGRIPTLLSQISAKLGDYNEADLWMDRAIECAKLKQDKLLFKEIYFADFELKKEEGKWAESILSYNLFELYKDSVFTEDGIGSSHAAEAQYYKDVKALENEKNEAEKRLNESEQVRSEQQQMWMWVVIGVFLTALIFVFQRFRVTSKQKATIHRQKLHVDEKNKEIMDSIIYAKRIQAAILPSDELLKSTLPNSFVYYLPKNVVAGDFYWLHAIDGKVLIAAADCTGHGVPGAMVSLVCNNALNRAVREYRLTKPAEILDKTREIVIQEFAKSSENVKDGMDISLCSINLETKAIEWAGANNPIWIVDAETTELTEIKGDKEPIGQFDHQTAYTNHQIQLKSDDLIYLFSDGFVDQFGGDNNKKYRAKQFKELLGTISKKPLADQNRMLNEEFESWKGDTEQIDDVCVVGISL
jgi:serine phosphatase RsbU (regulator of sigma subunit)